MFQEFLHPELVLFGTLLNPAIIIRHETSIKEGELVVHQTINRSYFDVTQYPSRMEQQLKERQIIKKKREEFLPQDGQEDQMPAFKDAKQVFAVVETPRQIKNIEGYYLTQQDPFDDQYYGFIIDAQYAPQQFGQNQPKTSLQQSPYECVQNKHIPFSEKTTQKVEEQKVERQQQMSQEIDTENAFLTGFADIEFGQGDMIDELTQM